MISSVRLAGALLKDAVVEVCLSLAAVVGPGGVFRGLPGLGPLHREMSGPVLSLLYRQVSGPVPRLVLSGLGPPVWDVLCDGDCHVLGHPSQAQYLPLVCLVGEACHYGLHRDVHISSVQAVHLHVIICLD